jgi:hypothetical protein
MTQNKTNWLQQVNPTKLPKKVIDCNVLQNGNKNLKTYDPKLIEVIVTKKQTEKNPKKLHVVMCFKTTTKIPRHIARDKTN